ncbi:tyrosine-type recombinase/integrase [Malikia sp.]|uniref:tyrosine-type recombinase/integrase n=1 Tax=Malikia sp. TaxID=2070706 RepID=UPI00261D6FAB|nr:tyrosine-type recombinase/integrase [Malikia sp.]MDD2728675.1 tyrosine-type recombinase/integrase [Malikia sp.]
MRWERYPAITLKAARQARDEAKAKKTDGVDPVQARQVEKLKASIGSGDTFGETAREWLERKRPGWSATHYERERRNVEKDLMPWLGPRKISGIEPVELLAVVKKVEDRGSLEVAHRVLMTAGGVWAYALATARADRIITQGLTKAMKPHTKKNLPAITDPVELGELLRASDAYRGGAIVRAALALAPMLFQRPGNLRTMRWTDLDLERALWSIPSEDMKRTKAGKVNGQPHVVPLPRQAVALLRELHPLTGGGEWVFPGLRNAKRPLSEAGVSAALARAIAFTPGAVARRDGR